MLKRLTLRLLGSKAFDDRIQWKDRRVGQFDELC